MSCHIDWEFYIFSSKIQRFFPIFDTTKCLSLPLKKKEGGYLNRSSWIVGLREFFKCPHRHILRVITFHEVFPAFSPQGGGDVYAVVVNPMLTVSRKSDGSSQFSISRRDTLET
ncbi:hypothetical protein CEXT_639881 [Caerostris extrusa]|uniref:Uncharacterized protein n=1 Tax=Caerostris extrusa TaxID=172846 RepID=A0AAV4Y2L4_CAEEX|nr:hypothetical protein CEXT_639881 [Caerostris extrusa]